MTTERGATGIAFARAALAGNPSDGYGGAVLALTLPERGATATVHQVARATIQPPASLVAATVARFAREHGSEAAGTSVRWQTTIPRAVGLGGSSAIVVATLRALCELHRTRLEPIEMARLALAIEVEDLGIVAGWQDRIAQTHDGLTFMDFASDPPRARRLDPNALPPLLVAWRAEAGGHSGAVHAPLRDLHARGEPDVLRAMDVLADAARDAAEAIVAGDHHALCHCVDASFDARRSMLDLDRRHVEMIELARAAGAAANYAGSGGAIIAVCADEDHRMQVDTALRAVGCGTLAPGRGRPWRTPPPDPTSVT